MRCSICGQDDGGPDIPNCVATHIQCLATRCAEAARLSRQADPSRAHPGGQMAQIEELLETIREERVRHSDLPAID